MGMDSDLDDVTEKELLLEIFRQVRWIARAIAVVLTLTILAVGIAFLIEAKDNAGL